MKEKGITKERNCGRSIMVCIVLLQRRGLLDEVEFEEKRRKERSWKDMSDEEVVGLAKKLMLENKITTRSELLRADHGLVLDFKK